MVRSTPDLNNDRETDELRQLRQDLSSMTMQAKQLDEANQAWQQYQQNQLGLIRDRLKLSDIDHLSFEDVVQQLEDRFNELQEVKSRFPSLGFRWIILSSCRIRGDYRCTAARHRRTASYESTADDESKSDIE